MSCLWGPEPSQIFLTQAALCLHVQRRGGPGAGAAGRGMQAVRSYGALRAPFTNSSWAGAAGDGVGLTR